MASNKPARRAPGRNGKQSQRTAKSVSEKSRLLAEVKARLLSDAKQADKKIAKIRAELSMKESDFAALDGPVHSPEGIPPLFEYRGFAFNKLGMSGGKKLIDSIKEMCDRKGLHGHAVKTNLGIEGEVWGLQDGGKPDANYKQMRKWFRNQRDYTVALLPKVTRDAQRTDSFEI